MVAKFVSCVGGQDKVLRIEFPVLVCLEINFEVKWFQDRGSDGFWRGVPEVVLGDFNFAAKGVVEETFSRDNLSVVGSCRGYLFTVEGNFGVVRKREECCGVVGEEEWEFVILYYSGKVVLGIEKLSGKASILGVSMHW